jgi:hypothetical protein
MNDLIKQKMMFFVLNIVSDITFANMEQGSLLHFGERQLFFFLTKALLDDEAA